MTSVPEKRNSKGFGTVTQLPNGRWRYRFWVTDGTDEKKRVSAFGATQKEAISKGRKLEEQYAKGLVAKKDRRTFRAFAQEWYERKERAGKADNTLRRYRLEMRQMASLNDLKLQAVKPF